MINQDLLWGPRNIWILASVFDLSSSERLALRFSFFWGEYCFFLVTILTFISLRSELKRWRRSRIWIFFLSRREYIFFLFSSSDDTLLVTPEVLLWWPNSYPCLIKYISWFFSIRFPNYEDYSKLPPPKDCHFFTPKTPSGVLWGGSIYFFFRTKI